MKKLGLSKRSIRDDLRKGIENSEYDSQTLFVSPKGALRSATAGSTIAAIAYVLISAICLIGAAVIDLIGGTAVLGSVAKAPLPFLGLWLPHSFFAIILSGAMTVLGLMLWQRSSLRLSRKRGLGAWLIQALLFVLLGLDAVINFNLGAAMAGNPVPMSILPRTMELVPVVMGIVFALLTVVNVPLTKYGSEYLKQQSIDEGHMSHTVLKHLGPAVQRTIGWVQNTNSVLIGSICLLSLDIVFGGSAFQLLFQNGHGGYTGGFGGFWVGLFKGGFAFLLSAMFTGFRYFLISSLRSKPWKRISVTGQAPADQITKLQLWLKANALMVGLALVLTIFYVVDILLNVGFVSYEIHGTFPMNFIGQNPQPLEWVLFASVAIVVLVDIAAFMGAHEITQAVRTKISQSTDEQLAAYESEVASAHQDPASADGQVVEGTGVYDQIPFEDES